MYVAVIAVLALAAAVIGFRPGTERCVDAANFNVRGMPDKTVGLSAATAVDAGC